MGRIKKSEYKTTIGEAKKALALAGQDKKIVLEGKRKAIIICELTKEQTKALSSSVFFQCKH